MPTETVYGLGADATNALAVARIFAAKRRPRFNPLIIHLADASDAWQLGQPTPLARRLAAAFWPGPLTLVLHAMATSPVVELATAGLDTVALRCPGHPVARALIAQAGRPIAAPSANRSGRVSPTCAADVAADLGSEVDIILDAGVCAVGLESTVVDAAGDIPILLRPGGVTRQAIEEIAGAVQLAADASERPSSPGQLASHYAPRAKVSLGLDGLQQGDAILAFGPTPLRGPGDGPLINLSPAGDLVEAAARLYAALRELDATGTPVIRVASIPASGLGEAILDRLQRAAAPRGEGGH
jgi:L-threonylcarbamoyladenylate synthase